MISSATSQEQGFPRDRSITVNFPTKISGYDYGQFFTAFDRYRYRNAPSVTVTVTVMLRR
jgi:hypothetical protein